MMIVSKTKDPQIRWIPHGSLRLSQCKSSCKRTCRLTKISRKAWINSKNQMVHKCVAFLMGRWGLAQRKSNCKEHDGSDIMFENITLFLDLLLFRLKFNLKRKKEHWKPWIWVDKRTSYSRSPRYYGHFFSARQKGPYISLYKKNR